MHAVAPLPVLTWSMCVSLEGFARRVKVGEKVLGFQCMRPAYIYMYRAQYYVSTTTGIHRIGNTAMCVAHVRRRCCMWNCGATQICVAAFNIRNRCNGGHIMLGGIVFQLVVAVFYSFLVMEFLTRWALDKPLKGRVSTWERKSEKVAMDARMKTMLMGLGLLTLLIVIRYACFVGAGRIVGSSVKLGIRLLSRSIYRTIELAGGWRGHIIRTQVYFSALFPHIFPVLRFLLM